MCKLLKLIILLSWANFSYALAPVEAIKPSGYGNAQPKHEHSTSHQIKEHDVIGLLLSKMDDLQQEVRTLKGEVEEQNHLLKKILSQSVTHESPKTEKIHSDLPIAETDEEIYQHAFELISKQKFDQAIEEFKNFLVKYPESKYCGNAYYWLGEIYHANGKIELAKQSFAKVVNDYPNNSKIADCLYKLGKIDANAGNYAQATQYLQEAIKKFPDSSAAKLSKNFLKNMKM